MVNERREGFLQLRQDGRGRAAAEVGMVQDARHGIARAAKAAAEG